MATSAPDASDSKTKKICRACTDFKTWAKQQTGRPVNETKSRNATKRPPSQLVSTEETGSPAECPADIVTLGRSSWTVLHSIAAYYPDAPSHSEQRHMKQFFHLFTQFFPCDTCAEDFKQRMSKNQPDTRSRHHLSQWLCRMHNEVNVKTGKAEFDCSKVDQRWRDGWADGSCD